jgi:hypothetical protein
MMPSFDVGLGQSEQCFHAAEQFAGKGHLGRPVHLGLDDVDAAAAAVADAVWPKAGLGRLQIVQRDRGGDHGVHDPLGDLASVFAPQDRRVAHQVADVVHEQQRSAVQHHVLAARAGVAAVRDQAAGEAGGALAHLLGQRALQDVQPVAGAASAPRAAPGACRRRPRTW